LITDESPELKEGLLGIIREAGAAVGIAIHKPWRSIGKEFLKGIDFLHDPVKSTGYMRGSDSDNTLEELINCQNP